MTAKRVKLPPPAKGSRYIPPYPSLGLALGGVSREELDRAAAGPPPTIECRGCGETLLLVRGAIFGIEDAYSHRIHGGCPGRPSR